LPGVRGGGSKAVRGSGSEAVKGSGSEGGVVARDSGREHEGGEV